MRRRVELARLMTVVDEDHETTRQPPGRFTHPLDGRKIDLGPPARLERHAEPIEVLLKRRSGRGTLCSRQSQVASRQSCRTRLMTCDSRLTTCDLRLMTDVDLLQPIVAHHDLMSRHRVEQLVRDQDAFE